MLPVLNVEVSASIDVPATTMRDQDDPSLPKEAKMPNYNQPHQFYAGVDLHARSMFVHVLSAKGKAVFERDLPAEPDAFLNAVQPFRAATRPAHHAHHEYQQPVQPAALQQEGVLRRQP